MTTPLTRYRLEAKADYPDPATEPDLSVDPNEEGLEWAGDLYEEGDETDPAEAFAVFRGDGELHAWLDRADDGTLTGWVRDVDNAVYRYSDVDAWAIDVRDASMTRTDDAEGLDDGEEDPEGDLEDPDAEQPPAEEGDDEFVPGDELPDEDPDAEDGEEVPADDEDDPADDPDAEEEDPAAGDDPAAEEDDEEDDFFARQKRKGEGKSYAIEFRPFTGQQ